jgi:uncharacterized membrane protein YkvA (DUF1232 family)
VYLAGRDPRVPWYAKLAAVLVAAYALGPIDLIPDFIPVLGHIDDLLILPLGIMLVVRLVPPQIMAEHRAAAERAGRLAVSWSATAMIVCFWITSSVSSGDRRFDRFNVEHNELRGLPYQIVKIRYGSGKRKAARLEGWVLVSFSQRALGTRLFSELRYSVI